MKTFGLIVLCAVGVLLVLLALLCAFIFNNIIWRNTIPVPKWILKMIAGNEAAPDAFEKDHIAATAAFGALPQEEVALYAPDGAILKGRVLTPKTPNGRTMLLCHGARSSGRGEFCFMVPWLLEKGYVLVIPDHRGCGESDGKYMGYGTHESKDTFLWLNYAKASFPENVVFLLGVSMGAATVLMMSRYADDNKIKGIIADCSYTSAWDEFSYQLRTSFHMPNFPIMPICDLYCRLFCGYRFQDASPLEAVKQAKKPILFIHGACDDFVPTFMQDILYDACVSEKEKLTVPDAVHARSYYTHPEMYQAAITEFMDKYDGDTV